MCHYGGTMPVSVMDTLSGGIVAATAIHALCSVLWLSVFRCTFCEILCIFLFHTFVQLSPFGLCCRPLPNSLAVSCYHCLPYYRSSGAAARSWSLRIQGSHYTGKFILPSHTISASNAAVITGLYKLSHPLYRHTDSQEPWGCGQMT